MRPFTSTIPLDEARAIIARTVRPIVRVESVPLLDASGRVSARAIVAAHDVPPFDRAGVDGYAVRAADLTTASRESPVALRCVECIFAAQVPRQAVGPGECSQVATGAPMPDAADAVVMVEDTSPGTDETVVLVSAAPKPGQNIGRQGADIRHGQTILEAGTMLNPSRLGAVAALGIPAIDVYARPRVAILSTGDEIVEPGEPLAPGHIYDINKYTLAAVVAQHGGVALPRRAAADTIDALGRAVEACAGEDVLVFSGGSSVGDRDLILDVLRTRGEVLFHGISVKPGKPTAFGRIGTQLVFGMPGYPTSCLSNAYILLAPALRQLARLPATLSRSVQLPLGARVTSVAGRHQFYTVRLDAGRAMPAFKASGDITSMSHADGYIEIAAEVTEVAEGTPVEVVLF